MIFSSGKAVKGMRSSIAALSCTNSPTDLRRQSEKAAVSYLKNASNAFSPTCDALIFHFP